MKNLTLEDAIKWRESFTGQVVVTNGVFDMLHPGHVQYLIKARAKGDALVIALNSDKSVKELKDPRRPIICEEERIFMLEALECVDKIVLFSDKRALNTIAVLRPDVYVKGGDYTIDTIDQGERKALEDMNATIDFISFKDGFSTTAMIQKIVDLYG